MTASTEILSIDPDVDADEVCAACGHPISAHDSTGLRYCAATSSMSRVRGCICKSAGKAK